MWRSSLAIYHLQCSAFFLIIGFSVFVVVVVVVVVVFYLIIAEKFGSV